MNKLFYLVLSVMSLFYFTNIQIAFADLPIQNKASFWDTPKKGANIFNQKINRSDIRAAKAYGIAFIRLSPDKFLSSQRDFLIGNADHYEHLAKEDLIVLKNILDLCAEEKMPVVLTMLSLPGSRWKQNNKDIDDLRMWTSESFQKQATQFWKDLALHLKGHPAIVGFNILNEPHIERIYDPKSIYIDQVHQQEVQATLFKFYQKVATAIRSVDQETPIILDSTAYADPKTFQHFLPQTANKVLYSFHFYEPYSYTNAKKNQGRFRYPGIIDGKQWDKKALQNYMQEVINFQKKYKIPSSQILVGEFGGHRRSKGLNKYFQDLIDIFKENKWHFAFYAFREDTWDGMDYELGDTKLPWSYWQAVEKGQKPQLNRKSDYPSFKVLQEKLKNT